jgi:hypothetical protein
MRTIENKEVCDFLQENIEFGPFCENKNTLYEVYLDYCDKNVLSPASFSHFFKCIYRSHNSCRPTQVGTKEKRIRKIYGLKLK